MPRIPRLSAALLAFAGLLAATGCSRPQAAPAGPAPVPVQVAPVIQKTVPVQVRAIGNVEAYSTVSIKAQVNGELTAAHFREGQDVRKGDLLFEIYKPPFETALRQAEANLARDKARAENARIQAHRVQKLFEEGVISSQQRDQAVSESDALDATVRGSEAAVERARHDLAYCTIRSPIDGRTGSLMVHPGNLVKANDVPILVVINQLNPIYVEFALPEQYLAPVKKYMTSRKLGIEALIPDDPTAVGKPDAAHSLQPERGTLSFVDNAVDYSTGTIKLKATFANQSRRLWPGLYVDALLTLTEQPNAVLIPSQAVQTGQTGSYVYVVKADNSVESRTVVTSRTIGSETIIEKGLQPGETVVTDGQLRLVPGAKVKINTGAAGGSGGA